MASIRTATGCWASALPATVIRSEATNAVNSVRGKLAARAAIQSNNREKRLRFDDIADPATKPVGGKLGRDGLCGVFAHKGEGRWLHRGRRHDRAHGPVHVAVRDGPANGMAANDLASVGTFGPEEQNRPAHRHRSVDLAGVNDSHDLVAHAHGMHVRRAEARAQRVEELEG